MNVTEFVSRDQMNSQSHFSITTDQNVIRADKMPRNFVLYHFQKNTIRRFWLNLNLYIRVFHFYSLTRPLDLVKFE